MIRFPSSLSDAANAALLRAGGTDLMERYAHAPAPITDLSRVIEGRRIEERADGVQIGALATIAALAAHPAVQRGYPGLAQAAGGLATPQIRNIGTVGGNLLQHVRCWYYRHPDLQCLKKGGSSCLARDGDHINHVCFDLGACAAPHASTLAAAFLAWDATVLLHDGQELSLPALLGDGSDPTRQNRLPTGAVLAGVRLKPGSPDDRSTYFRAIARARAEWPIVEVIARVQGTNPVQAAWITLGGVANVPLRATAAEAALIGGPLDETRIAAGAKAAREGAKPLPMTGYKVDILEGAVRAALTRLLEAK